MLAIRYHYKEPNKFQSTQWRDIVTMNYPGPQLGKEQNDTCLKYQSIKLVKPSCFYFK